MIDKVVLLENLTHMNLDISKFHDKMRRKKYQRVNQDTGEVYKIDHHSTRINNNIHISYSNITNKLKIEGRLINANYIKNKVFNFDDYLLPRVIKTKEGIVYGERDDLYLHKNSWYDENDNLRFENREYIEDQYCYVTANHDIEPFINSINKKINELLGLDKGTLDIKKFNVSNIEICFNIWLKNGLVKEYIKVFNDIFEERNPKSYKNYVRENDLDRGTSFYIKTKSSYRDNVKRGYIVNFYNKLDQLEFGDKDEQISDKDLALAKDVLRLEVQLFYGGIKKVCNENFIKNKFEDFIDLDLCLKIIKEYYERFIGSIDLDFYSYAKAKKIIEKNNILEENQTKRLLEYIAKRGRTNNPGSSYKQKTYGGYLMELGIHPTFIKTKYDIDYLKSPITLLQQKLDHYKELKDLIDVISIGKFYDSKLKQDIIQLDISEDPRLLEEFSNIFYSE